MTKYDGVEVFKDDFDNVISTISSEVKNGGCRNIYLFLGIGELESKLSYESKSILEQIFIDSSSYENSNFIFVDDYSSIKKLQFEGWYRACVDESNGIWLGDGANDQMVINIETLTYDDKKVSFPYMGMAIHKENHTFIKYVIDVVEEEDEE